jgi:hypothetical protein
VADDQAADLAELLAAGERAAFHGRPAAGVAPLQRAVEVARMEGHVDEATAAAWLLGVTLGAAGRYGSALAVLDPLADRVATDHPARRLFGSLAASTAASVHRQLGRHTVAQSRDERAVELAGDAPEALFDARLGLAADAVGLGDAETARGWLAGARALAEGRGDWWRQRVRGLWVEAEVALLVGKPANAVAAAEAAVGLAEASQAPRHVAKGLLFLGVAQVQGGDPEEAATTLRRSATLAESLGCLPLVWPSRAMLGAMLQGAELQESARSLAAARNAVLTIADDLPEALRDDWLGRADVAALLEG